MSLLVLFVGAGIAVPPPPSAGELLDVYFYDQDGATGSLTGALALDGDTILDAASGAGAIGSGTTISSDTQSATGTTSGAIVIGSSAASPTGTTQGGTTQPAEQTYD